MKICEALKIERLRSGKTQAEFAGKVFSAANYSKIERGYQEIDASDLFKLLIQNKINWIDFIEKIIDDYSIEDSQTKQQNIAIKLTQAYYSKNINRVRELNEIIQNGNFTAELKLRSFLAKHVLLDDIDQIDRKTKRKYSKKLFDSDNWVRDKYKLRLFANSMLIFDNDDLVSYISKILREKEYLINADVYVQAIVGSVCVNYLMNCYQRGIQDNILKVLNLMDRLPDIPELFVYKTLCNYFRFIFTNKSGKAQKIKRFMEENGLREFSKNLPM